MKKRQWGKVALLAGITLFLVACGNINEPITSDSTGLWDRYIVYNMSQIILWISDFFGKNYPLGITVFTILIRALMTPLYQKQVKSQREMMELQPELEAIKQKYPNKDRVSLEKVQEEQRMLMEERGINQFASLFPLLIQLPIMMALYQAILRTPNLSQGNFLWMNLGQPDPYFVLPIIAGLLTLATSYFTVKGNPNDSIATKIMMFINPLLIFFIALGLPSAIALYWVVTNAVTLVMLFIFNNPYKIIAEREAKIQAEKELQRKIRRQYRKATGRDPRNDKRR